MKVSLNWLSEYVNVPDDLKEFCDRLDLTGTGVEGIDHIGNRFEKIVTGKIVEKTAHPNSDHLWVTKVDVGNYSIDEQGNPLPLQIVCGAQNFNEGDHVVVALVGAILPGNVKIKKSKLRSVASCGMNCSEKELGLGNNHSGIMILPENAPIGVLFSEYLNKSDTVLDLEITPNRPDCLSMVGMSREVAAMYQSDYLNPLDNLKANLEEDFKLKNVNELVSVAISEPQRCNRYSARVIQNVEIGPSPDWLVDKITASGARSINNVVDITNYILYLFGQPLHAFDFDKIKNKNGVAEIVVRGAYDKESITTLDGEKRTLIPDMTVITAQDKPIALAGVMGGLDSEVTDSTKTILLETATFNPGHTSRTSRNLGLISEASLRYERGVDDNPIGAIADAAAYLLALVSNGKVCPGLVDKYVKQTLSHSLQFRIPRFHKMIGKEIPRDFIVDVLQRLGCHVNYADNDVDLLQVITPTFRPDLEREIDLYEEVLRLYGMNHIPSSLPGGRQRFGSRSNKEKKLDIINQTLCASGLNETMTYSFADPKEIDKLGLNKNGLGLAVELINPLNIEQSVMRQSIIPGLLRSVSYNLNRGVKNIALYESGIVFFGNKSKKTPKEKNRLAGVLVGSIKDQSWNNNFSKFDFFDGKGIIENLVRELAIPKIRFKAINPEEYKQLQPGRGAQIFSGGTYLGWVGEVHPLAAKAFDIEEVVVAFELDLDKLISVSRPARDYKDIPAYPDVNLDVAFLVDNSITNERLLQSIKSAGGKLLDTIKLFDVYKDEQRLGKDKKSMAYSLSFRSPDRTLTTQEVEKAYNRLISKVCRATGAEVRKS